MSRTVIRRFASALLALVLTACGRSVPDDGQIHISYHATPDVRDFCKVLSERFDLAIPGIKVDMVEGPAAGDARENMYSTAFMGKEDSYDLAYVDVAWVPKFAAQGWLRPLDELLAPEKLGAFLPGDLEGSRYQGKLYRLPVQSDGGMLYYRKDLLAAKNIPVPRTWEELVSAAKKTRTPAIAGFVFQGKQYEGLVCVFMELVWGFGGDLLDPAGVVRID